MLRHLHYLGLPLALAACNSRPALSVEQGPSEKSSAASAAPHACPVDGDAGSPLDVASEPPFRKQGKYESWTDTQGCLVRIDVLFERSGPEHCNQQETRVIGTGTPFGARYTNSNDTVLYVRDPNGVYRNPALVAGFNPMTDLPDSAVDTGFRRDGFELWVDPKQPSGIYLKRGRLVERWPRGDVPACQ